MLKGCIFRVAILGACVIFGDPYLNSSTVPFHKKLKVPKGELGALKKATEQEGIAGVVNPYFDSDCQHFSCLICC